MLTISRPLTAEGSRAYFRREFSRDDYYVRAETVGQWGGKVARALGLAGDVGEEAFLAVLNGEDPASRRTLVRGSNAAGGKRRAGWDLTFSAVKSVSLQALVGNDGRLVAAHDRAVARAVEEVERHARGRSADVWGDETGALVSASFRHEASRALDPQLHTHVVVANMTVDDEGRWRALESHALYAMQALATAVYRSVLAGEARQLGYGVVALDGQGAWEIKGVPSPAIEHFSKRRRQIQEWLAAEGASGARAAARAARETRAPKVHISRDDLVERWTRDAARFDWDAERLARGAASRRSDGVPRGEQRSQAHEAVAFAVADVTERDAVVCESLIAARALAWRIGEIRLEDVRARIDELHDAGDLISLEGSGPDLVTSRDVLRLEREVVRLMRSCQGVFEPIPESLVQELSAWRSPEGHALSLDQRRAAEGLLRCPDTVVGLEAPAGSGKSFALGAFAAVYVRAGYRVLGLAVTANATHVLAREAGVEARTLASFLRTVPDRRPGQVWIVDEASLVSTAVAHALIGRALEVGARVVLAGDRRQHAAIEAGAPFAALCDLGMATAMLREVRRQESPELLDVVRRFRSGDAAGAVEALARVPVGGTTSGAVEAGGKVVGCRVGALFEVANAADRRRAIAERTLTHEMGRHFIEAGLGQSVLVVVATRAERRALNEAIRARRRESDLLAGEDLLVEVLEDRGVTGKARTQALSYRPGDVVAYASGSARLGIASRSYARVVAVDGDENVLTVETDDGRRLTYDPRRFYGVTICQPSERRVAEGERLRVTSTIRLEGTGREIPNGSFATLTRLSPDGSAELALETGSVVSANVHEFRHLDYGYVTTSHASQGATVDAVILSVDPEAPRAVVNRVFGYVGASRARARVELFTSDVERLAAALGRRFEKASAIKLLAGLRPEVGVASSAGPSDVGGQFSGVAQPTPPAASSGSPRAPR